MFIDLIYCVKRHFYLNFVRCRQQTYRPDPFSTNTNPNFLELGKVDSRTKKKKWHFYPNFVWRRQHVYWPDLFCKRHFYPKFVRCRQQTYRPDSFSTNTNSNILELGKLTQGQRKKNDIFTLILYDADNRPNDLIRFLRTQTLIFSNWEKLTQGQRKKKTFLP